MISIFNGRVSPTFSINLELTLHEEGNEDVDKARKCKTYTKDHNILKLLRGSTTGDELDVRFIVVRFYHTTRVLLVFDIPILLYVRRNIQDFLTKTFGLHLCNPLALIGWDPILVVEKLRDPLLKEWRSELVDVDSI